MKKVEMSTETYFPYTGMEAEAVINMHFAKVDPNLPAKIIVLLESLPNVGFDQVNFLDTETGTFNSFIC